MSGGQMRGSWYVAVMFLVTGVLAPNGACAPPCSYDTDCPDAMVCQGYRCVDPDTTLSEFGLCTWDSECGATEVCESGQCMDRELAYELRANGGNGGSIIGGGGTGGGSGGSGGGGPSLTHWQPPSWCENPDPNKVYLFGTLAEGAAGRDVVADPERPYEVCAGFATHTLQTVIPPDGGFYTVAWGASIGTTFDETNLFKVDRFTKDSSTGYVKYPQNVLDNDLTITNPPCGYRLVPDYGTGETFFVCARTLYALAEPATELETLLEAPGTAMSNGWWVKNSSLFHRDGTQLGIVSPPTSQTDNFALYKPLAQRARANDFLIALPIDGGGELWRVPYDGVAELLGVYSIAQLPGTTTPAPFPGRGLLDSEGRLFAIQYISELGTFNDAIARYELAPTPSEIFYTEESAFEARPSSDWPVAQIHISHLFTGG